MMTNKPRTNRHTVGTLAAKKYNAGAKINTPTLIANNHIFLPNIPMAVPAGECTLE
jgi:hypothetical protein